MKKRKLLGIVVGILFSRFVFSQTTVYSDQIAVPLVNSASDESLVVISPDGQLMALTRKNHPQNIGGVKDLGDIWLCEKSQDGTWTTPYNLKEVNDQKNNQIIGFLDGGNTMLITKGREFSISRKNAGQWSKPEAYKIPYFQAHSDIVTGSVSSNEQYLLFGIESFGTYGVEDLYVCQKQKDGTWGGPKNLGPVVNSKFQEIAPVIAVDNTTLFFASNGFGGEGSFDIFMSTRLDESWRNWSTPVNLGNQINTGGKEMSYTFLPNSQVAYLISTQNSEGYGDIKTVKIQPEIVSVADSIAVEQISEVAFTEPIKLVDETLVDEVRLIPFEGKVLNKKTNEVLVGAEVNIFTTDGENENNILTNTAGIFKLNLVEGISYEIKIRSLQFLSYDGQLEENTINAGGLQTYFLEPIIEGNTIALDHVFFKQGEPELLEGSEKELDLVVEMMKYNPDISIFLSGHTDNQGNASENLKLSKDRVDTVKKYLIDHGIKDNRISGKGFGGLQPRASNANPETRQLNRRVEFTVHKVK